MEKLNDPSTTRRFQLWYYRDQSGYDNAVIEAQRLRAEMKRDLKESGILTELIGAEWD